MNICWILSSGKCVKCMPAWLISIPVNYTDFISILLKLGCGFFRKKIYTEILKWEFSSWNEFLGMRWADIERDSKKRNSWVKKRSYEIWGYWILRKIYWNLLILAILIFLCQILTFLGPNTDFFFQLVNRYECMKHMSKVWNLPWRTSLKIAEEKCEFCCFVKVKMVQ